MAKEMETIVKMSGSVDASLKSAIDSVADNIEQIERAAEQAAGPAGELFEKIEKQSEALKKAQLKYANYVLAGEESSQAAQDLASEIRDLSRDLQRNQDTLSAAERAAQDLADGMDGAERGTSDLGGAAADTQGGFTIMKGAIANLISSGIQWLIGKVGEAIQSLWSLAEETQEYREDMGKLETAWESAGKSTALATDIYKNFYSVLGEEDRSVEAVNHLAKFVDTEKDMKRWTDICTGVWGTFGDSLPIEGLTEAANETAKVGQVTGPLADALNWAGVSEDAFNESLAACGNEQERAALITDTLSGLYSEAADNYEKNNKSIIDARKATSDFTDAQATLGEKMEPVTTAVTNLKTKALEAITPVLGKVINAMMQLGGTVMPLLNSGLQIVKPILSAIWSALSAVASVIMKLLQAVLPPIVAFIQNIVVPQFKVFATVVKAVVGSALQALMPIINGVKQTLGGIISFIQNVFTGNWRGAWEAVKNIFSGVFSTLSGIVKAPMNAVISIINGAIAGINSISFDIPDWVPFGLGGKHFGVDIPTIPLLAKGGFTKGISIAGEEGTEAVISFNPAYRDQNLSYWAQAGRMLGATSDAGFSLSRSGGDTIIELGGVTFAPVISGMGSSQDNSGGIIKALQAEFPEFLDMLESALLERDEFKYG